MGKILTLEEAKALAENEIVKHKGYINSGRYIPVEGGWYLSKHFNISGLNGSLRYNFIKVLDTPILIKFSGRGAKWAGWVDVLYFQDGYTGSNTQDIHKYTVQLSCEAIITEQKYDFMPNGHHSGWQLGLSKANASKFKTQTLILPDIANNSKYLSMNDELKAFKEEDRAARYNLSEERKAEIKKRQIEIFTDVLSKL